MNFMLFLTTAEGTNEGGSVPEFMVSFASSWAVFTL